MALKEYHNADSSWHLIGTDPVQSSLGSDFTTSSTSLVDTGMTITTSGPSIILATIQVVKTGTASTFKLSLNLSAGTGYYIWTIVIDGTNQNNSWTSFNGDVTGGSTASTFDALLVAYISAAATAKIRANVQNGGDSIAVKQNSSEIAYPG